MIRVRRAEPDDAPTVAALAERTFVETFGSLYAADDLARYLADAYDVAAQRATLEDPACACFLLEDESGPIGHSAVGPCKLPHPDVKDGDCELKRLYVLADYQKGGLGLALCRASLDWLERDGPRTIWLGVYSENLGAQRFYARLGFEHVGEYAFEVGAARDREFIFRRKPRA